MNSGWLRGWNMIELDNYSFSSGWCLHGYGNSGHNQLDMIRHTVCLRLAIAAIPRRFTRLCLENWSIIFNYQLLELGVCAIFRQTLALREPTMANWAATVGLNGKVIGVDPYLEDWSSNILA